MRQVRETVIARSRPVVPGPEDLLDIVCTTLEDHKAEDVVVIDLKGKSTIGDYMVVATGRSNRHVSALAENLLMALKGQGLIGLTPEGLQQGDWVLIDAGDLIIHLFRPEVRAFYGIEKMWGAALLDAAEPVNAPA